MKILVLNAGSSSLKFQLLNSQNLQVIFKGLIEAIGLPSSSFTSEFDNQIIKETFPVGDHSEALKIGITKLLISKAIHDLEEITLIGHRVVHGGEIYQKSALINTKVKKDIADLAHLAPLHNPANLAGILSCEKLLPHVPQVAVFDTAFHQTMPEKAYLYGLPYELYTKHKNRRYGFHGINHKYVSQEAIKYLKKKQLPYDRIISCHLGNGCSITAINKGKSVDTSMGFTPLQGLLMGTRSGDLDPAIPTELCQILNKTPAEIETMLNKESGLKGVSGISSDLRILHQEDLLGNAHARRAIALFSYTLAKYIAAYTTILNGVDALIFTAGIGEHAYYLRQEVCQYLTHFKVHIDTQKNQANKFTIHKGSSKPKIFVIPANEELEIARETLKIYHQKD